MRLVMFYCYCGIRLHPLSCPEAFLVNSDGQLVGGESVKRLERDCFSSNGYAGIAGCSKCLNILFICSVTAEWKIQAKQQIGVANCTAGVVK
ncbi:hypothetical protein HAX54_023771 [Datura stramonium]|uniref:Uncharacterized protein n=1 Tax=Datura stramonium TaxID=4076 RepID=A0ABS8UZ44_DATST|nr:hypothetical protein [Datura stramonium]